MIPLDLMQYVEFGIRHFIDSIEHVRDSLVYVFRTTIWFGLLEKFAIKGRSFGPRLSCIAVESWSPGWGKIANKTKEVRLERKAFSSLKNVVVILTRLPILCNIERPLEQEVCVVIVIHEFGDGVVVSSSEHARRGFLLIDWKLVNRSTSFVARNFHILHFFSYEGLSVVFGA